jgi:alkaline phosphatase D
VNRRTVIRATGLAVVSGALVGGSPRFAAADPDDSRGVFRHGIASGDPLPDAVVIWTRVTPTEDARPASGVGPSVRVHWELGSPDPDGGIGEIVRSGESPTGPGQDHTVNVDVTGLDPDTRYAYRFTLGGARSAVGHTRTAPAPSSAVNRMRWGVVSCANWQGGYFSAYRFLAERDDLDLVLELGDYYYEYASLDYPKGYDVRTHDPATEAMTLSDYRRRHAQYKSDPDLRALHARVPWICMWDDHEVIDNRWRDGAPGHNRQTQGPYRDRRRGAYQAYFEWMPVRPAKTPLYRRFRFGTLAELSVLDLRSYRDKQARAVSSVVDDPRRSITGRAQFDWLTEGITGSSAHWRLIGNPVMMAPLDVPPLPRELLGPLLNVLGLPAEGIAVATDQWDGYAADRRRLLRTIDKEKVSNALFLTGDIHSSWANDIPLDAGSYPLSRSVATEFVGCSVTSDGLSDAIGAPPRTTSIVVETAIKALNRHVRFVEMDSHGSMVLTVTPGDARMDWYYIADRTRPNSPSRLAHSYRVPSHVPKVEAVDPTLLGIPLPPL